jgi:hypothetical protein
MRSLGMVTTAVLALAGAAAAAVVAISAPDISRYLRIRKM